MARTLSFCCCADASRARSQNCRPVGWAIPCSGFLDAGSSSLYRPGWPPSHRDRPASDTYMLELKTCTTTPDQPITIISCWLPFFFSPVSDVKVQLLPSHKRTDITVFKPFLDLDTQPVLFIPDVHFTNLQRGSHVGSQPPGRGCWAWQKSSSVPFFHNVRPQWHLTSY